MVRFTLVAATTVLVVVASSSAAVKPKPWMWDTQTAAQQVARAGLTPLGRETPSRLTVKCVGKGKQIQRHYTSFACTGTLKLFVKVRPVGKGQPCVSLTSLATVPAACMAKGTRTPGTRDDARNALRTKLQAVYQTTFPYQGPTECAGFGAGFFQCWFGINDTTDPNVGTATVVLAPTPVVNVTRMPPG